MRIPLPLIPVSVEFHRRPLKPLRLTSRSLMIAVVAAAILFSLLARVGRLHQAGSYHAVLAVEAAAKRPNAPPYKISPAEIWHQTESNRYHNSAMAIELVFVLLFWGLVLLLVVGVVGRLFDRRARRPATPERERA